MSPKEKAKELFTKFSGNTVHFDSAKSCALIAVGEMLGYLKNSDDVMVSIYAVSYWKEVEQEIENL